MIPAGEHPAWPTTKRGRLRDGRLQGVDGSLWLYRAVPMANVTDARTPADSIVAAEPLLRMFEELSDLANVTVKQRRFAKGNYRNFHCLLVNVPQRFAPGRDHALGSILREEYPATRIDRRILLFGVRLKDSITGGGFRSSIESVVETIVAGSTPLSDYDEDTRRVSAAMDRSGLVPLSAEDIRLADSWWNHGEFPDTAFLYHPDHLHVFPTVDSMQMAKAAGVDRCIDWTPATVPGTHALTFAAVQDVDLNFVDATDPVSHWISTLIDHDALCVSVRGVVEPGAVTREELRRQRKRFIDDINERYQQGKMEKQEQEEMLGLLGDVEGMYATSGGTPPPTLASTSIIAAFNGQYRDVTQIIPFGSAAKLALMNHRQDSAMAETWLCSHVRANPHLHDLPVQTLACSGLPSLAFVGDKDGALVGFSERDRQPSWLSPIAASRADGAPLMLVAGGTGSGKSLFMNRVATQFARMGRPTIVWDPKVESSFDLVAESVGGQVYSLDALLQADGVFDPIRFAPYDPKTGEYPGVEIAADMLMSINPWGDQIQNMEVPLLRALRYGAERGGTCIGQCLAIAKRDLPDLPPTLVSAVEYIASASPQFRAICGVNPSGVSLKASDSMTLIKVGKANLNLPEPGSPATNLTQKISMAIVRMVVFGSAMALMGRDGVLCMDEAWIVLGSSRSEVERLGRLARSQRVLPILFTQRVTDAVNAGLRGYISRGLILPLPDPDEAIAACTLFDLEPTPERIQRIVAKATVGGNSTASKAPNWQSMRALRDPATGEVLRGTIGIYCDLDGSAVPVEIALPKEFLEIASTSPEDVDRRLREAAARQAAANQALAAQEALLTNQGQGIETQPLAAPVQQQYQHQPAAPAAYPTQPAQPTPTAPQPQAQYPAPPVQSPPTQAPPGYPQYPGHPGQ